jgi:hypothetical protein
MPTAQEVQCLTVLYGAATAELGLVVRTNDPVKARAALYHARNAVGDAELKDLTIRVSPDDTEGAIWIIRKKNVAPTVAIVADLL